MSHVFPPPSRAVARRSRRTVAVLACALLAVHAANAATPDPASAAGVRNLCDGPLLDTGSARAAVDFVARTVASAHVAGPGHDASTLQGLRTLAESIRGPVAPASVALAINRELARAGDAHLRVDLPENVAGKCGFLPIGLEWTDAGLLVATEGGPVPAGSRIAAFGGRSLAQLEALAREVIPSENPYWARSELARLAVREDWAASAGLRGDRRAVEVAYVTPAGTDERTVLTYDRPVAAAVRPWVGYELFPAHSTGYFWMDRCDPSEEFLRTLDAFVVAVRDGGIRKVAIDLRRNPGGDAGAPLAVLRAFGAHPARGFGAEIRVSEELLAAMPMFAPAAIAPAFESVGAPAPAPGAERYQVPAPLVLGMVQSRLGDRKFETAPGRALYLLTGGATFSSAALFSVLVRDNSLGQLVGDPIGNSASFNGSELVLPVPGLPHELHLSSARLSRPDLLAGESPTVLPDALAPATSQSIARHGDPALDFVRQAPVPSP